MSLLEVRDVVKDYRIPGKAPLRVLRGVSFAVEAGEHVAVVGRSGGGKTTLLNILGGLDRPTSGEVALAGQSLFRGFGAAWRRCRLRATKIGFVFQSFHLMPELDVLENVLLPAMTGYVRGGARGARARARELLERVGLKERMGHLPSELSGGEQQRAALARALVCRPEIILADEPTGNLDALTGEEILKLLFEVDQSPCACVMVTHSAAAAARCDRALVLDGGRLRPAPSNEGKEERTGP